MRNFIGVDQRQFAQAVRRLVPDFHPMGSGGMAEMGSMEMAMPDNTLPMMTGFGQFGPIEMGGMFTLMKVRDGLDANDYHDPGPYRNPEGTVAYEVEPLDEPAIHRPDGVGAQPPNRANAKPAAKPHR
jgi:manganese oxidase